MCCREQAGDLDPNAEMHAQPEERTTVVRTSVGGSYPTLHMMRVG
jgi:hypothetical protein